MINASRENKKASYTFVLIAVIFCALVLQVVHLPAFISENRPDLLILIIIFFSIHTNFTLNIEVGMVVGLILDLVTGAPLGINAFIICTQTYLISSQFKNFSKYNIIQQLSIIGIVNLIVSILGYWIEHIIGQSYYEVNFIIPALSTAIFWPVVYGICLLLCNSFSIKSEDSDNQD